MDDIATLLLDAKAVLLRPNQPFTYTSGLQGPIYCDNRLLLSLPKQREIIITAFLEKIKDLKFDVVAGTATAGIAWASWIARELKKPLVYIRGKAKGYGRENQIEGTLTQGQHALIVEDIILTGGSSVQAVDVVKNVGAIVTDCVAISTYGLDKATEKFRTAQCAVHTLTDFFAIVKTAKERNLITEKEQESLLAWQKDPEHWK